MDNPGRGSDKLPEELGSKLFETQFHKKNIDYHIRSVRREIEENINLREAPQFIIKISK